MGRFILTRALQALISLFVVTLVTFFIIRLTGDPVDALLPIDATREQIEQVRTSLGLDEPFWVQYRIFMANLFQGDLGESTRNTLPVSELIRDRLPATLQLGLVSLGIGFLIAIPLGVYAAANLGRPLDWGARIFAVLGQSIPLFWMGILFIQVFAVWWGILPAGGKGTLSQLVLPTLTLGIYIVAGLMRLTRSAMLEVLSTEYIKMARLKGVSEQRVLWIHGFRNAAIPVLTFAALLTVGVMTGSVIVETVFAWPGLGRLVVDAVRSRDFPIVQGVVLLFSALYILANFLVDVLYAYLNPRIRY